ncbi:MAG: DUF2070 family protein [Candidatus Geothermarchaeales archaeon]
MLGLQLAEDIGRAARHYQTLFTLHSLRLQLIVHAFLSVLFLVRVSSFELQTIPQVLLAVTFLTYPIVEQRALFMLHSEKGFFSVRRTLAANTVSNFFFALPLVTLSFFPTHYDLLTYTVALGTGSSIALRILVYGAFSKTTPAIRGTFALAPVIIYALLILVASPQPSPSWHLSPTLFLASAALALLAVVDSAPKGVVERGGLELFRTYMYSWVLGQHGPLERILEDFSEEYHAEVQTVIVEGGGDNIALVAPYVHYGPFGGVGSSVFPADIRRTFRENGVVRALALHTPTSHSLNVPSRRESLRLIQRIRERLEEPRDFSRAITPLVEISLGKARAAGFGFDETAFVCLSYEEMEDVPTALAYKLRSQAKQMGFHDAMVVDAHNSLSGETKWFKAHEIEQLSQAGTECLQKVKHSEAGDFRVALCSSRPPDLGPAEGLGYAGVAVFLWEVFKRSYALIIVDANNFSPRLRRRILDELKSKFNITAEVLTTDTHEVTARKLVPRGYVILGESEDASSLIECVNFCARSALSELKEARVAYDTFRLDSRIVGENGLQTLTTAVEITFKAARRFALGFFGLASFLSAVTVFL